MKKVSFLFSVVLIAAFVLTACGPAEDNTDATPGVGAGDLTAAPTFDAMPVDITPVNTEPPVVETPMVETPVVGVDPTEAMTEEAGVPVTGECRAYSVQGLLDMDVYDAQNVQIGDVDSLIVLRDARAVVMDESGMTETTDPMVTPAATEAVVEDPAAAVNFEGAAPQVAYLVVDLENEDDEAVIPFGAFTLNTSADAMNTAGTTGAVDPTAYPVENTNDDGLFDSDDCFITANNLQADALGDLPRLDDDIDFSVENWDEEYRAYWSSQGLMIPATGDSGLGAAVRLNDEWDAVDAENVNGDDLGEVEDFFFTAEGQFDYAVLTAGGFLGIGEKYVPVPVSMIQWISRASDNDMDDVGQVIINVSDDDWENAPSFDSLDAIDNSVEGWDDEVRSFWDSVTTPN